MRLAYEGGLREEWRGKQGLGGALPFLPQVAETGGCLLGVVFFWGGVFFLWGGGVVGLTSPFLPGWERRGVLVTFLLFRLL